MCLVGFGYFVEPVHWCYLFFRGMGVILVGFLYMVMLPFGYGFVKGCFGCPV